MDDKELKCKLDELLVLPAETEWVEFKEAKDTLPFDTIGQYFSALSNEANLKGRPCGWLVLGVRDKPRDIVGSRFRIDRAKLDSLKHQIAEHTTEGLTFLEICELQVSLPTGPKNRVVMFKIPPAPRGIPVAWKGHWYGRDGESLVALNVQEFEQIRSQVESDWSAQICEGATLASLDPEAILKAREEYKTKNSKLAPEVDGWDDIIFLNKARVLIEGRVTHAAILLLGKEESEHFLSPAVAKMTWLLKDNDGADQDYEHLGPPFILRTDEVFAKIRNLRYRYMRDDTLFPVELTKYEQWVIREAMHNCIAHQDYRLHGRINVVETPDSLLFTNVGSFIPGSVEHVIEMNCPPERYRNRFLADAMVNLNMIDIIGGGIKKMFTLQRQRFFPLPEYDLSDPNRVEVRIIGKVLDENYTRALMTQTDLTLWEVIALDKVQKGIRLSGKECRLLRSKGLVEGRRPNLYVAATVAAATGRKASYIRNRAFDKDYYKKTLLAFLTKYGSATREEIDSLLMNKISDVLTREQKQAKISNLLQEMRKRDESIHRKGSRRTGRWLPTKE